MVKLYLQCALENLRDSGIASYAHKYAEHEIQSAPMHYIPF